MPIKFKCPHCGKQLSVKDELAGKRAKCPNPPCGQPLRIPAPEPAASASPAGVMAYVAPPSVEAAPPPAPAAAQAPPPDADAEALAASLLADEPAAAPAAPTETIKFNCSYCDETVQMDVAMAGKQAPCPECRRIIKVPALQAAKKTDWRNANAALPSGARRDNEPAPEGAWGTVAATRVSGDALEEADALPDEREPVTIGRWIARGVVAASVIGVLVFGTLLILNRLSQGKLRETYDKAMAEVSGDKPTVGGYKAAVIHLSAGTYHLRSKEKDSVQGDRGDDDAWVQYGRARLLWAADDGRRVPECDTMLIELALAQMNLLGNETEIDERMRLPWDKTRNEIHQTLNKIRNPAIRMQGMRQVARRLIERGQAEKVSDIASQPSDSQDVAAVAVLELQLAGKDALAGDLAKQVVRFLEEELAQEKSTYVPSVDVQAVMILKGARDQANKLAERIKSKEDREEAEIAALVAAGNLAEARNLVQKSDRLADVRFRHLAVIADVPGTKDEAKAAVEEVVGLLQTKLKNQPLQSLPAFRMIDAGLRNGIDVERLRPIAERVLQEERLRAWVQLLLFRHVLTNSSGTVDDDKLSMIDKGTLSQLLARVELARHNTKHDSDYLKQIDDWDEALRAFGWIGAALGMQNE